jgi:hypothetical protein
VLGLVGGRGGESEGEGVIGGACEQRRRIGEVGGGGGPAGGVIDEGGDEWVGGECGERVGDGSEEGGGGEGDWVGDVDPAFGEREEELGEGA